jgi:hypothetical protein
VHKIFKAVTFFEVKKKIQGRFDLFILHLVGGVQISKNKRKSCTIQDFISARD